MNLAKHPSSTIQILGAEKALFRALKTKHDTPKYGLLYHASLVGGTNQKVATSSPVDTYQSIRVILLNLVHIRNLLFLAIFHNLAGNKHVFLLKTSKI